PAPARSQSQIRPQTSAPADPACTRARTVGRLPHFTPGERPGGHAHREVLPMKPVYDAIIPAGEPWVHEIRKGQTCRIVDLHGNRAVDTLFYNAHDYSDRYSAQATLRHQRNI